MPSLPPPVRFQGRGPREPDGTLGDTVNLAARLDGLAVAGEILVGPSTADLVRGAFDLDDAGTHSVKGKLEPIAVARVAGIAASRTALSRRHGTFVGRQEEFGILVAALERARDGESGVITVVGDAGAGKTRLLAELHAYSGDGVQWLEGRAYAHGDRIPYAPVIDLISRVAGISEVATSAEVVRRLSEVVTVLAPEDADRVLAPLLRLYAIEDGGEDELDREVFHVRLVAASVALIEALARLGPTVLVVQDLHWADPPSINLLREVLEEVHEPILVICNTRPGVDLEFGGRVLALSDLSGRQTRQLIASLLGSETPPSELVDLVERRADGNPFFIEEIVNNLIESGVLTMAEDGHWRVTSLDEAAVPSTVRGVIAARIDRLDPTRRRVLQEAAVVGREFLYRVMDHVTTTAGELSGSLATLERADLIREKTADPDLEYFFKHALTQEVAYEGLLKSDRQVLHQHVAEAIEQELAHRSGELTETLAHHWLRAGDTGRAVHYLRLAGAKAVERYALDEADAFYRDAYELLSERDRSIDESRALAELLIEWMLVPYYLGDLRSAGDLLGLHEADFARIDDAELSGMALAWRGNALWVHGDVLGGVVLLDRAIALGAAAGSAKVEAHAIAWKLWALFLAAKSREALALGERLGPLIALLDDDRYVVVKSEGALGYAHCAVGHITEAVAVADHLVALGERTGSTRALSMGHGLRAALASTVGDWERGIDHGRRAVDAASDPIYRALAHWVLLVNLANAQRIGELRELIESSRQLMATAFADFHFLGDGLCHVLEGRPARGMRMLAECERRATDTHLDWLRTMLVAWRAIMYARIATRELDARMAVVVRNPGFVIRHALGARRRAHAMFEAWDAEFIQTDRLGSLVYIVYVDWAKLLVDEGKKQEAARLLTAALDATSAYGPSEGRTEAVALLASLG